MADIFVSYARADKARVTPLVAALEAQGWSVWWDPAIIPGQEFDDRIAEEIDKASAVVVVWTPASVASRWVRGEAREAADRGILAPVRFENARLPIDVRAIHTTDLDDWDEDAAGAPFQALLGALSLLLKDVSKTAAARGAGPQVSVCVLPFANMSNDSEQEYFSDGISEDIITDLSKVSALTVISRNSAFTFKGRHVDLPEVARQLKVTHVLEGSVRKAGNRVRITAQLIDGATNGHVWADRWDRNLDDIFALQDEISEAIVAALKISLFPEEKKAIEGGRANNLEVYDKFLRARERFNTGATAADFLHAGDLYRETLALDPDFAEARGGLILVYVFLRTFAPGRAAEWREELAAVAREALSHAPNHWTTHLAHGMVLLGQNDWLSADEAFSKMAALAPASASASSGAILGALFSASVGRVSEGLGVLETARLADPLSIQVSQTVYQYLGVQGRLSEAQEEYERAEDLRGGHEVIEHHAVLRALESGDAPAVKAHFQRYLGVATVTIASIEQLADIVDQPAAALVLLKDEFENLANQDSMRMLFIALYAGHFGDTELALAALARSDMAASYRPMVWEPLLKNVRRTAGFKQLVRELGLADYWRKSGKWGDFARPLGDDDFEVW